MSSIFTVIIRLFRSCMLGSRRHGRWVGLMLGLALAGSGLAANLTISWVDNSWDEDGFSIERSENGGPFVEIHVTGPDVSSWDHVAPDGVVLVYRVRAHNSAGYSGYSNVATNAATIVTPPPAVTNASAFDTVNLSVVADGVPAPTYEWKRNGTPISADAVVSGVNSATLTLTNVLPSYAGIYTVTITNGTNGWITSTDSVLNIPKIVPSITWSNPASIDDDIPLSGTQLNASANVPGVFVYTPAADTKLAVGMHTLTVDFTPDDTVNYTATSKTVSIQIVDLVPTRPSTFDAAAYLALNPDVAATIGNVPDKFDQAWTHYYKFGIFEGRNDGDFNVQAYMAQYPNAGATPQAAAVYWYNTGRQNGDRVPAGFSVAGYFLRNSDIAAIFANDKYGAWLHYYNYGVFEGRSYDANFIVDEYLELNPDLKGAFGTNKQAALMHWLTWGHPVEDRMGRVPIGFNVDSYLARYPDLQAVFGGITPTAVRNVTVWHHYIDYGTLEGRSDGDFEAYNYLATNPDLAAVFGTDIRGAALHWYFYGRREGRRIPGGFDVQDYRARYPDIVVGLGDDLYGSWLHYRDTGVLEGRVFGELFRPAEYLALNPDVAAVIGTNYRDALLHWLYYGQFEGRLGRF